jgi:hypothetical protein
LSPAEGGQLVATRRTAPGSSPRKGRTSRAFAPACVLILLIVPPLCFSQESDPAKRQFSLRTAQDAFRDPRRLQTVQEIRKFSNAEASKALPVELEGVVTYSDPEWGLLFGIYVLNSLIHRNSSFCP